MDEKLAKSIHDAHMKTAALYRDAADQACAQGQTYEVWTLMNAMMTEERKARQIARRWLGV